MLTRRNGFLVVSYFTDDIFADALDVPTRIAFLG
jgi:hypothetical protein